MLNTSQNSSRFRRVAFILLVTSLAVLTLVACQVVAPPHPRISDVALQADAGEDFEVMVDAAPNFDGCGSTGNIVNYKWVIAKAPESMPEYDGKVIREVDANCSFTLEASMLADDVGTWEIDLVVSDAGGRTSTDAVVVDVVP